MSNFKELIALKSAYKNRKLILFLGAGISGTLGLPNWSRLIGIMAEDLGYDPDVFKSYADNNSYILAEYYYLKRNSHFGRLRTKLDQEWHSNEIKEKLRDSDFHRVLATKEFPLIYTTNYDEWIEKAFELYEKPYSKITNIVDISSHEIGNSQIVKFHGDFSDDDSIILNESSYFRRMTFQDPLDIKFRSDILSNTVLFMGYSLSDNNIRNILYILNQMWNEKNRMNKPPCYILVKEHNEILDTVFRSWNVMPITAAELGIIEEDRNKQNTEVLLQISS
ncbi:SIR2 family protein [uncultured Acinetobacter sp.]|uniref:SIR2 family protein n=1 Tax=uncultured Acinetobacter sp. TaxID=165433 RepID=UPI0025DC8C0F|nr:SIR2 family protein [uncultured Acinetobacter sp.]